MSQRIFPGISKQSGTQFIFLQPQLGSQRITLVSHLYLVVIFDLTVATYDAEFRVKGGKGSGRRTCQVIAGWHQDPVLDPQKDITVSQSHHRATGHSAVPCTAKYPLSNPTPLRLNGAVLQQRPCWP